MKYCMTVTHSSTIGEWEPCKASTLAGAKREATARFGDGYVGHTIEVAQCGLQSERPYIEAVKTIGFDRWLPGFGYGK